MPVNLRNRSFVKWLDLAPKEITFLLKLSADLKAAKYGGYDQPRLKGKKNPSTSKKPPPPTLRPT